MITERNREHLVIVIKVCDMNVRFETERVEISVEGKVAALRHHFLLTA